MFPHSIITDTVYGKTITRDVKHNLFINNKKRYANDHRTDAAQIDNFENYVRQKVQAERLRLDHENGLIPETIQHFTRTVERPFTGNQRSFTTILFGGLTKTHEKLLQGALEGLGYRCKVLPTPDVSAFQLGKEYGNKGQCNPVYFTVGSLLQYLRGLRKNGLSIADKIEYFGKFIDQLFGSY